MVGPRRVGVYVNSQTFYRIYCSYRRWRSEHPPDRVVRPYNLEIKVIFESHAVNSDGRVMRSNSECLDEFNKLLDRMWRDKTIICTDDPEIAIFKAMEAKGLISLSMLPDVGAEAFSLEMFNWFKIWLTNSGMIQYVDVRAVEVIENTSLGIVSASLYSE